MAGEAPAASSPSNRGAISTGFIALDGALGTGGWPRGALALLDAPRGAGATSLAIRSLAAAQEAGGIVAWIDGAGCLDVAGLARMGVSLEWLLVVRPASVSEGVELAGWLARSGLVDATVLDLGEGSEESEGSGLSVRGGACAGSGALVAALDRLGKLLVRGRSVALLLTPERLRAVAGRVAAVRLSLEREAWLAVGRDLVGQRVRATVDRHRWALAGAAATLDLWFAEGRRIDQLLPPLALPRDVAPEVPVAAASLDLIASRSHGPTLAPVAARDRGGARDLEERIALRVLSA
jgi:recombination protein RecA